MNSTTIFEYIQELEKRNEQLKELYRKSEEERVATLEKLNSKLLDESIQRVGAVLNEAEKPSLYETTTRTKTFQLNEDIAKHLRELGDMTSDFFKAGAYNTAADIIATLDFEVQNGESLLEIKGIGKGIASKIDHFLDEYFDDSESIASNEGQILEESDDESETESDDESETESDDESETEFFVSYNHEIDCRRRKTRSRTRRQTRSRTRRQTRSRIRRQTLQESDPHLRQSIQSHQSTHQENGQSWRQYPSRYP